MASSEKATCSQKTPTGRNSVDEPTDKRKRPLRFSGPDDIQLLREVVSENPFKDTPPTTTWASISRNLKAVLAISPRRCRERTILLLDQYVKGDLVSLQRFCTKDELAIKEQLLQQVQHQYDSGAGGYRNRIGCGMAMVKNSANAQDDDDDDLDPYRGHVVLEEDATSEHSDSGEASSEKEDKEDEQPVSAKRPRLTKDDVIDKEIKDVAAALSAEERASSASPSTYSVAEETSSRDNRPTTVGVSKFHSKLMTCLLSRQAKEAEAHEQDMKIRHEELQLEKARLRLAQDKLALEKERFEIERQERELRLRSEVQQRTVFVEVLKKVFSDRLGL